MAKETPQVIALAMLGAVESAHFYSAFLPSMMTINKFAEDEEAILWLRRGEVTATGLTFLLGWILSELTDSYLPIGFAAGMAVIMLIGYEYAIRGTLGKEAVGGAVGLTAATIIPGMPPYP